MQPEHLQNKKRARYVAEQDILDDIDEANRRVKSLRLTAENLDHKATQFYKRLDGINAPDPEKLKKAEAWRDSAEKKRGKADKIEGGHMTHLKNKLAEFQTATLPGVVPDQSITK